MTNPEAGCEQWHRVHPDVCAAFAVISQFSITNSEFLLSVEQDGEKFCKN